MHDSSLYPEEDVLQARLLTLPDDYARDLWYLRHRSNAWLIALLLSIHRKVIPGGERPSSERVKLFKLAWDLVGDSISSRQVLYERFFSGDLIRNMALRYVNYDTSAVMNRVNAFLEVH